MATEFVVGDWLIQPGLNRVSRHGSSARVRPQLMDLLVCLARHAGRTVSRDALLTEVWPGQSFIADSGVARCVAELRQALGDRAGAPTLIQTIPKRGYRLIAPVQAVVAPHGAEALPSGDACDAAAGALEYTLVPRRMTGTAAGPSSGRVPLGYVSRTHHVLFRIWPRACEDSCD
ncbi:MAG: transcriptional regulator [Acidobacteria bacterium]|nr:transcriptional regulator [Acidobacteriota bacterium]